MTRRGSGLRRRDRAGRDRAGRDRAGRGRRRLVVATAVAVTAVLAGCGADGPDAPTEADDASETAAIDVDAAVAAAIDVRALGCGPRLGIGTGAVIDGGFVVTAAHVVAGGREFEVIDTSLAASPATVVYFDPDLDLAVLDPDIDVGTSLPLRPSRVQQGEVARAVLPRATPDGLVVEIADLTVVRRANIATTDIHLERDVERAGFEVEGSIDPGDSGAMVVTAGGGVGIIWARSNVNEQRAWAIDLPASILDGTALVAASPVDVGRCVASPG